MTRDVFHRELRELEESVVQMGIIVEEAIARSMQALGKRDIAMAQGVIRDDGTVNELQNTIRTRCFGVMARQQPVARDLRELVTIQQVINELERMADHAVNIAKMAIRISSYPQIKQYSEFPEMARLVEQQVHNAIQALIEVNVQRARDICVADDVIDGLYKKLFTELISTMAADPQTVNQATSLLFIAHHLERIGDRVTNICEDIIYMVTGEIEELN